jgi:hypothetical protein
LQVELEAPRAPPGNRGFFFWPTAMFAPRLPALIMRRQTISQAPSDENETRRPGDHHS